jgi:hypothetical protein
MTSMPQTAQTLQDRNLAAMHEKIRDAIDECVCADDVAVWRSLIQRWSTEWRNNYVGRGGPFPIVTRPHYGDVLEEFREQANGFILPRPRTEDDDVRAFMVGAMASEITYLRNQLAVFVARDKWEASAQ